VAAVTVYDRDELLAAVDLAELATEVCGPGEGRGPSAKWRCPNPDHPDTHPSMTVYAGQRSQRWKCHSCGDGGTAIDLVMTARRCGVRDAIEALAARANMLPDPQAARPPDPGPQGGYAMHPRLGCPVARCWLRRPVVGTAGSAARSEARPDALSHPPLVSGDHAGCLFGQ